MQEPKRTDLLNHLATKHNLKRYLEIGVQNPVQNFDKIICEYKVSVDPDSNAHASFCMTSDDFFMQNINGSDTELGQQLGARPFSEFDLIFIDGLHTAEQVKKDFENALKILSPNGFIVLHDCNPLKEEHTIVPRPTKTGNWHGDVWKYVNSLHPNKNFVTVDIDCGCGVWFRNKEGIRSVPIHDWNYFNTNRNQLLNLIDWCDFIKLDYANI